MCSSSMWMQMLVLKRMLGGGSCAWGEAKLRGHRGHCSGGGGGGMRGVSSMRGVPRI